MLFEDIDDAIRRAILKDSAEALSTAAFQRDRILERTRALFDGASS